MKVYQVPVHADQQLIEKIAGLLMQQMTRHDSDEAYQLLLNGINEALTEDSPANILVAEENGDILGVAFFNVGISLKMGGPYVWLNDLFVHNDYRNQGIAKKLLLHLIRWAERENIRGIELETGVNNSVTKHLYNSLGFHDIVSNRYCFNF
ncbi:GNAT family N-acetyltransferase [Pueribacillus theae]|uniref:GNAT family N-acetyltransferase n=1 Tax=Pueribacillus theae TaxID=2171751 RepID=A0A2U1JXT5_9BACI|nr:GNAT family N-acetyltransferase [Pueribacillus theae]PWA10037.1 GNAT family N-acetyltransferase [Pueribacillus theae]